MTEQDMQEKIAEALMEYGEEWPNEADAVVRVRSFEEDGVLTMNAGLTVRCETEDDGEVEFQVTIVRSR
jgi:translation initiation factor 2 alpha subunit (eIF-2alpha)